MSLKSIFLSLAIFLPLTDAFASNYSSDEQKCPLEKIRESDEIKSVLLERSDRGNTERVILIGLHNPIRAHEARLIGNTIEGILNTNDDCFMSGECKSLHESLPYITSHMGTKDHQDIENIEGNAPGTSSKIIRFMDQALGLTAKGAALVSFSLNYEAFSSPYNEIVSLPQHCSQYSLAFPGCQEIGDKLYRVVCVDGQMELFRSKITNERQDHQNALISFITPVNLSMYSMFVCALALGAQSTLRSISPAPPCTAAVKIAEAIIELLRKKQKNHIVSLVLFSNFDGVKAHLHACGFESKNIAENISEKISKE